MSTAQPHIRHPISSLLSSLISTLWLISTAAHIYWPALHLLRAISTAQTSMHGAAEYILPWLLFTRGWRFRSSAKSSSTSSFFQVVRIPMGSPGSLLATKDIFPVLLDKVQLTPMPHARHSAGRIQAAPRSVDIRQRVTVTNTMRGRKHTILMSTRPISSAKVRCVPSLLPTYIPRQSTPRGQGLGLGQERTRNSRSRLRVRATWPYIH